MNLVNIYNDSRTVYLFIRNNDKTLSIIKDDSFFPYYYEKHPEGKFKGFDGVQLKKMIVGEPQDIRKLRSENSYESDINFCKRYVIDKIASFDPAPLRWSMFDMETQSKVLPRPRETQCAPDPVSCLVLYDNYGDTYKEFFRPKFKNETDMLYAFAEEVKGLSPDLLLAHNLYNFDYPYLFYRLPGFAERLSPLGKQRYFDRELFAPAGISLIDTLEWWQKKTLNKEESYAQEQLMIKYLGHDKGKYSKVDFTKLDDQVLGRCRSDVEGMVALEKKVQLIPYNDMIRRIGMVDFEDLKWNSRVIDMLLLKEAKKQGVVLPMKPVDAPDAEFEGAIREALKTGVFNNVGKYDLSGAYLYNIINLCLDSVNIVDGPGENIIKVDVRGRESNEIEATYYVKQNPDALLPKVVGHLVAEKNKLKDLMGKTNPESPEYKNIEQEYNGFKSVVLSGWGVIGNKYFRRYDSRVAAMTTGCVRDLLFYVISELKTMGIEVIYYDTDSSFILDGGKNISELLNSLIQKWAMERFNKEVSIRFDHEGHFKDIFILAKCRYRGHLDTGHGIKDEVKGIETKRKDSTVFMKTFQKAFFDKVLAQQDTKEQMLAWIQTQIDNIKTTPLTEIASPVKLSKKPSEYKTNNIVPRTLADTKGFHKNVGEPFFIIAVEPEYYTVPTTKTKYWLEIPGKKEGTVKKSPLTVKKIAEMLAAHKVKVTTDDEEYHKLVVSVLGAEGVKSEKVTTDVKKARDMQAFDEDNQKHLRPINWERMVEKNILKKLVSPFKALGWTEDLKKFGNVEEETADEPAED